MLQGWSSLLEFRQMAPLYKIKLLNLMLVDTFCTQRPARNHAIIFSSFLTVGKIRSGFHAPRIRLITAVYRKVHHTSGIESVHDSKLRVV